MTDALDRMRSALSGRYAVERELGSGGMATVFLAEDLKHRRQVAVKALKPELAAAVGADRFLREIETTARLRHPHILPLHDSGEIDGIVYYVMPYVPAGTLRDRMRREGQLPVEDAIRFASEVAEALDAAHREGVIHRDIKPENVLIDDGHAVVADFGIALPVESARDDRLTMTGSSLGTPEYMSPEQAFGAQDVDHRTDIYSLGCLLFEMLAGEPPYSGPNVRSVLAKQASDAAPAVRSFRSTVSTAVERAISKALAKAPADRFDSAAALARALVSTSSDPELEEITIVVLPFENRSSDPENQHFGDGLTDEITTDLSRISALTVISRMSAMTLKGTTKDPRRIGGELGVTHILTGSVRRAGDALRITAELVDARRNTSLWSEKYSGTMADVFDLQEEISRRIVDGLEAVVTPEEASRREVRAIPDLVAYQAYLLGRQEISKFTLEGFARADALFDQALEASGENALLLACKAYVSSMRRNIGGAVSDPAIAEAEQLARRALELDPDCALAHMDLGFAAYFRPGEYTVGLSHFRRAVELEPSNRDALMWLSASSAMVGRSEQAIHFAARALRVDPLTPVTIIINAFTRLVAGRSSEAFEMAERVRSHIDTPTLALAYIWTALAPQGRFDEVSEMTRRVAKAHPREAWAELLPFFEAAYSNDRELALVHATPSVDNILIGQTESSMHGGGAYAQIGEIDRALRMMEHSASVGFINHPFLASNELLQPLWEDPRGQALLGRIRNQWETLEV